MTPTLRVAAIGCGVRGMATAHFLRRHDAGPDCVAQARQTAGALVAQLAAPRSPEVVLR